MEQINSEKVAVKVSVISIVVNLVLSIFKLIAGFVAHSNAMISDAVHSASDVFSTFVVIVGVKISAKEADEKHQYGHERLESVAAIILAMVLCATGLGIGINGVESITSGQYKTAAVPGMLALAAAIISIVVKEAMYWYTRFYAKKINSTALMADAWHHRSDALSSIGSLIGIGGSILGFKMCDSVASIVICIFIVKASVDIFRDAISRMTDESCSKETELHMEEVSMKQDGVMGIDMLKTRKFGAKIYIDVEISADGELKLMESHRIAERVHDEIEKKFPGVKHCMVHVNPYDESHSEDNKERK